MRTVQLIDRLGDDFEHSILALDGCFEACAKLGARERVRTVKPPPSAHALMRPLQLMRILDQEQPDVAVTYNWGAIEMVLAAALHGGPTVIHVEDGFGPDEAAGLKWRRVLTRRFLLPRAFACVFPSETLRRIARAQYALAEETIRFIPNGVDLENFRPGRDEELRQSLGAGASELLFGTVGQLRPEKSLDLLLCAFQKASIPGAKLIVVGDGACRQELERLAVELEIGDRVRFTGASNDPVRFLQAIDIFLMSSSTEQLPLSLLEAMACGLPSICTDAGDTGVALGTRSEPEVVPIGDVVGYSVAMRRMAAAPELRVAIGQKNRERCERFYGITGMVDAWRSIYREAVGLDVSCPRCHSTNLSMPSVKPTRGA